MCDSSIRAKAVASTHCGETWHGKVRDDSRQFSCALGRQKVVSLEDEVVVVAVMLMVYVVYVVDGRQVSGLGARLREDRNECPTVVRSDYLEATPEFLRCWGLSGLVGEKERDTHIAMM